MPAPAPSRPQPARRQAASVPPAGFEQAQTGTPPSANSYAQFGSSPPAAGYAQFGPVSSARGGQPARSPARATPARRVSPGVQQSQSPGTRPSARSAGGAARAPRTTPQRPAESAPRRSSGEDGARGGSVETQRGSGGRAAAAPPVARSPPAAAVEVQGEEDYEYFDPQKPAGGTTGLWAQRKRELSRPEAESALRGQPVGSFLLRNAESPAFTKLSVVVSPTDIQHHLIKQPASGVFEVNSIPTPNLRTLDEVILWLRKPANTPWDGPALDRHI